MLEKISSFFVSPAWALAPPGGEGGGGALGGIAGFLPLILIFVIFYFLLIRPQQKKAKDHKAMTENLRRGDKVVTSGGIYGLVEDVGPNTVTLKIAENVKVKFGKQFVASLRVSADEA